MTLRSLGKISLSRYQPASNDWDAEDNARNRKSEDDVEDWDCNITSPTVPWLREMVDDGWTLTFHRTEIKAPDWLNKDNTGQFRLQHYLSATRGEFNELLTALAHELLEVVK